MKKIELKWRKKIKELDILNYKLNEGKKEIIEELDNKGKLIDEYKNELY